VDSEQLIVRALRGELPPWDDEPSPLDYAIPAAASDHGVSALLSMTSAVHCWPDAVRAELRHACRCEAAMEALRRETLIELLAEFTRAGVRALLLKGAQIAYTHYTKPWLRPRLDTDVLVTPEERTRADAVLCGLGYRPGNHFSGALVTHQFRYDRTTGHGITDVVDLHWRIANPHLFAGTFTFEELAAEATSIPALGPTARGLSDAHALVLACIHRVAHHDNSDRLIWLYDIHLLASGMSAATRETVADLANAKGLRAVCLSGIERAQARFATPLPDAWIAQLRPDAPATEASAAFLQSGRSKLDTLFSDLRMLDGWSSKLKLIGEHLFPPPAYIRQAYGLSSSFLVPFGYLHRIAFGIGKWFQRRRHAS
jgi:hypothetical protein